MVRCSLFNKKLVKTTYDVAQFILAPILYLKKFRFQIFKIQ
jgi:hypothetical protein